MAPSRSAQRAQVSSREPNSAGIGPDAPETAILDYMTTEVRNLWNDLQHLTEWVNDWADRSISNLVVGKESPDKASIEVSRTRVDELRHKIELTYAQFHKLREACYRLNEL